eukprot:1621121-Alexandrium_andersonii.AAC.1
MRGPSGSSRSLGNQVTLGATLRSSGLPCLTSEAGLSCPCNLATESKTSRRALDHLPYASVARPSTMQAMSSCSTLWKR